VFHEDVFHFHPLDHLKSIHPGLLSSSQSVMSPMAFTEVVLPIPIEDTASTSLPLAMTDSH
jgi:hypothetical protein